MKDRFWASCLVIIDYIFAALAWGVFFYLRKTQIEEQVFIPDSKFYLGLTLVPLFWISIYYIQGTYQDILHEFIAGHMCHGIGEFQSFNVIYSVFKKQCCATFWECK